MTRLIMMSDFSEAFPHNILKGIREYSKTVNPYVVYRMSTQMKQRYGLKAVLDFALRWKADAIVGQFDNDDNVAVFAKNGILAIAQDYQRSFVEIPNLTGEYLRAGAMAAEYFLSKGFRNFAFFGYEEDVEWSMLRGKGFREKLEEFGFECHMLQTQSNHDLWEADTENTANWIRNLPKPCALMACDDMQAFQLMEIGHLAGISIPQDVAFIGVDDDELFCSLSDPELSSIGMNLVGAGFKLAETIDNALKNPNQPIPDIVIHPTKIIERASTDIYSFSDKEVEKVVKHIREHYTEQLSTPSLMKLVPLSRRNLEQRFRNATGISIYQMITDARMDHFLSEIQTSGEPMNKLALKAGFSDYKSFLRIFRRRYGCNPSEMRLA